MVEARHGGAEHKLPTLADGCPTHSPSLHRTQIALDEIPPPSPLPPHSCTLGICAKIREPRDVDVDYGQMNVCDGRQAVEA